VFTSVRAFEGSIYGDSDTKIRMLLCVNKSFVMGVISQITADRLIAYILLSNNSIRKGD